MTADAINPEHGLATAEIHPVEEQFHTADQQRECATLGIWTFLSTEILFFGGMFVAYGVYRLRWENAFLHGSRDLKWYLGAFNTATLLLSSFAMAMAVHAAKMGDNVRIIRWLATTMVLACVFLSVKFTEYYLEYDEGLVPGRWFRIEPPKPSELSPVGRAFDSFEDWLGREIGYDAHPPRLGHEQLFMCFYFIMTAIHATHMLIGLGLMTWLVAGARQRHFSKAWHNPVEVVGLYWHFVDMVWVFLFPILYLLRNP